ncbi:MAG: PD-(D/E)XK nuclease family protein [Tannerella sp.]|nr:PD-(D/E)XK nuclease family protein [Tannerella sp.]
MKAYRTGGGKALSASTINTYLDCPLRFYFSAIEELKEEEEVLEGVESREFGTIFHRVAEWLYDPFCGKPVTGDLLKQRASQTELTRAIEHAFSELFFRSKEVQPLSGRHYLIGEVIRKYIEKLIEKDSLLTPFRYIRSEQKIQYPLRLSNGTEIQLKGFIDRLDEVDGAIRVVDYKTGSVIKLDVKSMESLFDPTAENRQSAIMQVFMYAYLFSRQDASRPVRPTLYYVRDFFSAGFNPLLSIGKEKEPVSDFSIYRNAFEDGLRSCLDRIFDPDIPFTQTSISKVCGYCPFGCVCGR